MKTIAMVVVMVALAACEDAPPIATPAPTPPTIEQLARTFAMEKITPALLAPATADYPITTIKSEPMPPLEDSRGRLVERVCVRGGVDAHNPHGAFIRNEWKVVFLRDGESFKPVEARLQNDSVFIDNAYNLALIVEENRRLRIAVEELEAKKKARLAEQHARDMQQLADMRERVKEIPSLIEEHERALAALPKNPAGGVVFGEIERRRKAIENLKQERDLIEKRFKEVASLTPSPTP